MEKNKMGAGRAKSVIGQVRQLGPIRPIRKMIPELVMVLKS